MTTKEFIKNIFNMPLLICVPQNKECKYVEFDATDNGGNFYCHGANRTKPILLTTRYYFSCPLMREE